MSESYVVCEGYHDRAFWAGLLMQLGCSDPGARSGGRRERVFDPFGIPVVSGQYGYLSRSGAFVRVVPVHGKTNVPPAVRNRLRDAEVKPLTRLVANVDTDLCVDGSPVTGPVLTVGTLEAIVREVDSAAALNSEGDIEARSGATKVSLVPWQSTLDGPTVGVPHQETLERVVCAAIVAAHPLRGPAVQQWLDTRPQGPPAGPKAFAFSYLAGWYESSGGFEGFYAGMWSDREVVDQLMPRLRASGVLRVAEALAF